MIIYMVGPNGGLYRVVDPSEQRDLLSQGFKRIPRAQWRQLKREQKAKEKQLSHDLMYEQAKRLMG